MKDLAQSLATGVMTGDVHLPVVTGDAYLTVVTGDVCLPVVTGDVYLLRCVPACGDR